MFDTLGYRFKDNSLLSTALTHTSFAYENKDGKTFSNERLEFLGDAVLELIISSHIFNKFPDLTEGELTKLRASIVCEDSLSKVSKKLKIGENLMLGKGEEQNGGRNRPSILADAFEAILGAIYLDGGFNDAEKFILEVLKDVILQKKDSFKTNDSKTLLQEIIQKNSQEPLVYKIISEEGPAHDKVFTVEVFHKGSSLAIGGGKSKKDAEQDAATIAIKKMNIINSL